MSADFFMSDRSSVELQNHRRFHDLDALRAVAMLLGIFLHGLLAYVENPVWSAQDLYQNTAVYGTLNDAIHGFRMPLFFLVSGFFTAMLWRRRGMAALIKHRAKRILLPLFLGLIVLWPLQILVSIQGAASKARVAAARSGTESDPSSPIWTLSREGNREGVQQAIDRGADVNALDPTGTSPLTYAALMGHAGIVEDLIAAGADVNAKGGDGGTALHAAAFLGRFEAAKSLLANGAEPSLSIRNSSDARPLESLNAPWEVTEWILGMIQIKVDKDEVLKGRVEIRTLLAEYGEANGGGLEASESSRGDTARLWGIYQLLTFAPILLHLWFLWDLCLYVGIFCVVALGLRSLGVTVPQQMITGYWRWAWLLPLTFAGQFFMRQAFGPDTTLGILPWPPKLLYYGVFFGFGALCYGKREFEFEAGQHWVSCFLGGLVTLVLGLYFFRQRAGNFDLYHPIFCLFATLYVWLMVYGFVGFFRKFFNEENPRVRYLSDASYFLYLFHIPPVVALQALMADWGLPSVVKLAIVCGVSTGILLVIYEYAVRYTWIGAILNGRKYRSKQLGLAKDQ